MSDPAGTSEPRIAGRPGKPPVAERAAFQAQLDDLRVREKAHTREGDAIAAARRQLPMVEGPYDESARYRDFMGWDLPRYSAQPSLEQLFAGREIGLFHLICYLRDGDRVFETYWTKRRGVEAMDYSYALMDLTVYGRQEPWEYSPDGWPRRGIAKRTSGGSPDWPLVPVWPGGRPTSQWPRIEAGRSDDLRDEGGSGR